MSRPLPGPLIDGEVTLETRWFVPGEVPDSIAERFQSLPWRSETREDRYLVAPAVSGVSVKVRGAESLDMKLRMARVGICRVGAARGSCALWQKWAFPLHAVPQWKHDLVDWLPVHKSRTIVDFPACHAELTQVVVQRESWWTFGLESAGALPDLEGQLRSAAEAVLAVLPPGVARFGLGNCMSYSDWLQQYRAPVPRERARSSPAGDAARVRAADPRAHAH